MLEKQSRGIDNMRGRRSHESNRERMLIEDAGFQLALASGNAKLGKQCLGCSWGIMGVVSLQNDDS